MIKPLLIEIGVEELPAIPFLKELPHIETLWLDILEKNALACAFNFYYTPRRLVLWHEAFPTQQNEREEEFFGAPLSVALKEGVPTPAALGFAKKCGVDFSEISRAMKEGKEVLYYKKTIAGQSSKNLLQAMVEQFIKGLNFGKSMRWGFLEEHFIRPIRWIGCMMGDEHVPFSLFGVESTPFSYPHRTISYEPFAYMFAGDYFERLAERGVVLYPTKREEIILNDFKAIEAKEGVHIEIDEDLLAEVVAITEHPKALIGSFEERFLRLPPEVIITSMKENQRYFPVFKEGKLTSRFIVVSNAISDDYDLIVRGNEKVLRARLSDALFFLDNDLKNGLHYEGLKDITYLDGLGSLLDKELREKAIATYLTNKYQSTLLSQNTRLTFERLQALMDKSVMYSKSDLLSEMVYEFTELQGLMGYYYATAMGEDELFALALKEQYLPNSEESVLPSTLFSAIVALSYKLDSLIALFSIDKIPTGNKDPYALRRAVNGIVKIVLNQGIAFDIKNDLFALSQSYKSFDFNVLETFFLERMYQFFDVNPSIITAVISSGEREIVKMSQKIKALSSIVQDDGFKEMFSTFKRVANIIKNMDVKEQALVDETLFDSTYEKELYAAFTAVVSKNYASFEENLDALFALKPQIDAFFNNVMVNTEDVNVRANRHNLIASIYNAFKAIADIKEISI
ncbi:glycine--tRNA ligase subunit beta [Sulfurospirillum multivorans]|uniref:Glycine--tRNA ligase beta subunit n=2 Tax=Sulfurospirillum multivorans TaxID=66821 RepID=A0AA86AMJ0_SULMK|nr:glycine--tRNA ligase subunit beta [Sulfurospirillum multivorans]AHJ13396.1 glycine--tRNA ligase beta subunit [Sulfurospirillum multivorans DSM 12446]QEH06887.1 glycine--tRNA ligase beta subunit [Sulfurospirillum multivorans]